MIDNGLPIHDVLNLESLGVFTLQHRSGQCVLTDVLLKIHIVVIQHVEVGEIVDVVDEPEPEEVPLCPFC